MRRLMVLTVFMLTILISKGVSVSAQNINVEKEKKYVISSIEAVLCDTYLNCEELIINIKLNSEKLYDFKLNDYGKVYEFHTK